MITRILTDRTNYAKDIEEMRIAWLDDLLSFIGLDLDVIHNSPRDVAVEYLVEKKIEIVDYINMKATSVKQDGELIGEWSGPEMKLKEDDKGDLYFDVKIENWSIIDEQIDDE
jgi:hypothetical protein